MVAIVKDRVSPGVIPDEPGPPGPELDTAQGRSRLAGAAGPARARFYDGLVRALAGLTKYSVQDS